MPIGFTTLSTVALTEIMAFSLIFSGKAKNPSVVFSMRPFCMVTWMSREEIPGTEIEIGFGRLR